MSLFADATAPAIRWSEVTPDGTATHDPMPRALFVGGSGDVALEDRTGSITVWPIIGGQILPVWPLRVRATATTATNIIALW